uniref:Lysophosphatidylcholine acyltransferase 1-like n=1 Tax=Nothobranchius furzeri TaxID=105023 RepID=A0A8C6NTK4_NOTFU
MMNTFINMDFSESNHTLLCYVTVSFHFLLCCYRLRSGMRDRQLEEHVKKARSLEGTRLGLEELAQFLTLPVSDTLTQVYNLFEQSEDGQMDIRHYIVALSTVLRPPKSFETLKLAFEMYENERGEIREEDLAVVMEIMLGVKNVDLSGLFLALGKLDERKITYGKTMLLLIMFVEILTAPASASTSLHICGFTPSLDVRPVLLEKIKTSCYKLYHQLFNLSCQNYFKINFFVHNYINKLMY